jgi:adenosine kinase
MNILITGSVAYDYIMAFPDSFKNHILPDQIHILNVSFTVDTLKKEYGGCAANIAYNCKLLGGEPIILAPLGTDGDEYLKRFKSFGIKTDYIPMSEKIMTSSAYITTDRDDNQIIAFYPGAGVEAADVHVSDIKEKIEIALISPTDKDAMVEHAKEAAEKNIPIVFDPGQQITALSPQELMLLIGQAKFLIGNDYEIKLIQEKTGWGPEEILKHVEILITTLGSKGSIIRTRDEILEIKPCPPQSVDDPTGAGDAYRAGFFTAYVLGKSLKTCAQIGSVSATYAVENYGTQNHSYTVEEFAERYEAVYVEKLSLN